MDWDTALGHIQQYIEKHGIMYRGGVKRFLMNNQQEINTLLAFTNFKKVIAQINQSCQLNLDYNYCNRVFLAVKPDELRYQRKSNAVVSSPVFVLPQNIIKHDDEISHFHGQLDSMKNLNRISKNLIIEFGLTKDILKSIGVWTMMDKQAVENKIKRHCHELKNQALHEEYKHILKKEG